MLETGVGCNLENKVECLRLIRSQAEDVTFSPVFDCYRMEPKIPFTKTCF